MTDQRASILAGLADGKSLRSICTDPAMPNIATVMRWCSDDTEWREQYMRAREAGDDAMAEDIQAIADDGELDPNDRRIRIDARKWLLAKRQPKKYGDKLDVEHGGQVQHTVTRIELIGVSAEIAPPLKSVA